jgi:linoleoyl-CoA desaturase
MNGRYNQLKSTANFATKNKFISWWVGGLNFQVEHHFFQNYHTSIILLSVKSYGKPARKPAWPYIEHDKVSLR